MARIIKNNLPKYKHIRFSLTVVFVSLLGFGVIDCGLVDLNLWIPTALSISYCIMKVLTNKEGFHGFPFCLANWQSGLWAIWWRGASESPPRQWLPLHQSDDPGWPVISSPAVRMTLGDALDMRTIGHCRPVFVISARKDPFFREYSFCCCVGFAKDILLSTWVFF